MNSEVYRAQLSAQIQPNAAKLTGRCFTVQMDNDQKHTESLRLNRVLVRSFQIRRGRARRQSCKSRVTFQTYWSLFLSFRNLIKSLCVN